MTPQNVAPVVTPIDTTLEKCKKFGEDKQRCAARKDTANCEEA
jgi:hypothetical protein